MIGRKGGVLLMSRNLLFELEGTFRDFLTTGKESFVVQCTP
jgi:hypothetical protein